LVKPRRLFQARGAAQGGSALVPSDFRQLALLLRPSGPKVARYARPAPRPRNSRLRCVLSQAIGLEPLPSWQDAVGEFIANDSP